MFVSEVLLFPFEAGLSGASEEQQSSSAIFDFPLLRLIVEFDGAGSLNLQPPNRIKVDQLGVEAGANAVGFKGDGGCIHMICCNGFGVM